MKFLISLLARKPNETATASLSVLHWQETKVFYFDGFPVR